LPVLAPAILALLYGDASGRLMDSDTHDTPTPNSKGIDVKLERVG